MLKSMVVDFSQLLLDSSYLGCVMFFKKVKNNKHYKKGLILSLFLQNNIQKFWEKSFFCYGVEFYLFAKYSPVKS